MPRAFMRQLWDGLKPYSLAIGWVAGLLTGGLVALAGFLSEADRFFLLVAGAMVSLASVYVLNTLQNKVAARIAVSAVALAACLVIGLNVRDRREAADNYQLIMLKNMMERDIGTVGPDGKLVVRWAHWRVDVHNPNDFVIYASFQRRFGSIKGDDGKVVSTALDTDAEERADIEEIEAHTSMTCGSDRMDTHLSLGRTYTGDFSCIIKYGREKGDLKKTFEWTRKPVVTLCPGSNNVCDIGWN